MFLTLQRITQTRTHHLWHIQITNIFPSHCCYSTEACLWCLWWCLNYQHTQPNQTWHWVCGAFILFLTRTIKLKFKPHGHSHSCSLTFATSRLFTISSFFCKTQCNPFHTNLTFHPGKKGKITFNHVCLSKVALPQFNKGKCQSI